MKKIGIGVGVLLVLLIASALIVPGFIDWNQYKTQIEMTASDLSERQVAINGDLSLSILPSPSFSAQDVSVSNVEGGQATHFVTLKSVDVNVAFFPLLRGEIQVKKFILVEPVVALEVNAEGRGNWEFGSAEETTDTGSGTELSFEQFQIENGQLSYQDFSTGTQELLRMIDASVSMDSLQGPFEIEGRARYKNLPISMNLMVGTIREGRKVPINLTAGLLDNDVQIKFAGGALLDEVSPQADGKINLAAQDVGDIFLAVALLDPENTNQNGPKYNHPISLETTVAYGGDAINVSAFDFEMGESRGSGKMTATFGEMTRFDGNLSVNSLNLDSFLSSLEENDGSGQVDPQKKEEIDYTFLDTLEGNFTFKLGALQYNDKIASQMELDMTASNRELDFTNARVNMPGGSELTLNGAFSAPGNKPFFNGNVGLNSGNFRAFLDWLKIDTSSIPTGRLTRFAYKGAVQATPQLVQLYGIDGSLDTVQFSGGLSYAVQDRPSMGLDMQVQNLNVDNYLPAEAEEQTDYKKSVAILGDFDANYKIDLSNVTTQGITIKKVDLTGELFDGKINAKTINVEDFAGFDLNGSLIGNNLSNNPQFETSFNTTAASLVPLQRAYRFKTAFDISEVGAIALNARMSGDFEQMTIDVKSTIGSSKADIKGEIRSATLSQFPEIGSADLEIVASNPSLASLIDQFDLPIVKASANDDRPVSVKGTLKGTQQLLDLDGTLSIAGGTVALKGRTNIAEDEISSYDFAVDMKGPDVREFVRGLGAEFRPSKANLGPLALEMAASGNMSALSLSNIVGTVGPTKLTGSGEITQLDAVADQGQKPNFNFNLVLDDVPVADFMEAKPEVPEGEQWGNWSKEPMDLAVLEQYDGRATVTANRINYEKYDFENPRFDAVLKDGVLTINNFTGKLFGGDVAIAGTFSSEGELAMDMSLKNASVVDATSSFAGIRPITGYFDMTQKITGKGTSQEALISSLNGTGAVTASPGTINGINVPELSERINGLSSQNGLLSLLRTSLSGGQTPYDGGSSALTTKNGFIQLSPLDVNMLGAKSDIDLGINLAQWQMDLNGDMSLSDHPDAPPIGISVLGDLHNPKIAYNTKQLEGFIGQKIAASLIQNMVEGNGGIGDLFGGGVGPEAAPTTGGAPAENEPVAAPSGETPAPNQDDVTTSPLDDFLTPPPAEQTQQQAPAEEAPEEQVPAQETRPQSVEELGTRLLERLFQKPAQQPQQAPPND